MRKDAMHCIWRVVQTSSHCSYWQSIRQEPFTPQTNLAGAASTMPWPTASLMNNSGSCNTFFTKDVIQIVRTMMPTTLCGMPWKQGILRRSACCFVLGQMLTCHSSPIMAWAPATLPIRADALNVLQGAHVTSHLEQIQTQGLRSLTWLMS